MMAYDAPSYLQYGQPEFKIESAAISPSQGSEYPHPHGEAWRGRMSGQASLKARRESSMGL